MEQSMVLMHDQIRVSFHVVHYTTIIWILFKGILVGLPKHPLNLGHEAIWVKRNSELVVEPLFLFTQELIKLWSKKLQH
jgi:hypothetical protein